MRVCMTTQAWGCLRAVKRVDGYPEFDARVRLDLVVPRRNWDS